MDKVGYVLFLAFFLACNNETKTELPTAQEEANTFNIGQISGSFPSVTVPYQPADTTLLNNKDTVTIRNNDLLANIPDSIEERLFGKNSRIKYSPLAKVQLPNAETYLLMKGTSGSKRNAIVLNFKRNGAFGAAFPFLVLDADKETTQISTLDKNGSITRSMVRKMPEDVVAEGKDVYVYNKQTNHFDLIMTDLLDDSNLELINPIDTLARTHKWAGDYTRNKNNIVSVRNGRKPELLTVFIHIEKKEGACVGEIKGDAQITGPDKAVYRQAGDPCVLELNFKASTVTLREVEGCGSRRNLECSFDGNFSRKKEASEKTSAKKKKQPRKSG